jgi:hypothetical protein
VHSATRPENSLSDSTRQRAFLSSASVDHLAKLDKDSIPVVQHLIVLWGLYETTHDTIYCDNNIFYSNI